MSKRRGKGDKIPLRIFSAGETTTNDMTNNAQFSFAPSSPSVLIFLPDGHSLCGPRGAPVGDFLKILEQEGAAPIVGAVINGELRELTYSIQLESQVCPVTMAEADGMRIYRRSLTFLLDAAFRELYPGMILTVDHSVSSGGYFCQVVGRGPLAQPELEHLEERMRAIVAADKPFARMHVPLSQAIEYFKREGLHEQVRLLSHRKKDYLTIYNLDGHYDYHHGYMVPSTGYLRWFALALLEDGFALCFPRRHAPTQILPLPDLPKLLTTFRQYGDWLERLNIGDVGALDDAIQSSRSREIILVSEALHEQLISDITHMIAERQPRPHIILIAGPSCSGKTTFSKRLSVQLLACGVSPFPLEMDHYFVDRESTPRDENGNLDFESIDALDRQRLSLDLKRLIAGEAVQLPHYDFISGTSGSGEVIQLKNGESIILEGIHGLNPNLLPDIPSENTFRIYVSALTQINLDRHNRVSTTDTRLIRRIVRDARERGYTAQQTITRWESVRRGEKRYIFPYQENCEIMFNSALVYELAALKPLVEPLLRQVPHGTPEHIEAKRLLAFLEWFLPLDSSAVPDNSILREFIGDSILSSFKLWHA